MRRFRSGCCARAPSGQTAATPPNSVMKSRRLINFPEAQREPSYRLNVALGKAPVGVKKQAVERRTDVRFGSKADIRAVKSHVRFTPESGHVQCTRPCLLWANSGHHDLFDDFISGGQQLLRDHEA
jgi:hypothetical protein